jgi:hypothetical protein
MTPKPKHVIPPWLHPKETAPDNWVKFSVAASRYFRKSIGRLYQMNKDGSFKAANMPTWFDGSTWWIRLPIALPEPQKSLSNSQNT